MTFESSNSKWVESLSDEKLVAGVRLAMGEGPKRNDRYRKGIIGT